MSGLPDDFEIAGGTPAVEAEAVQWLVRMASGEADAAERAAFAAWRQADPAHESALIRMRQLWVGLGPALQADTTPLQTLSATRPTHATPRVQRPRRRLRSWAAAASVVLALTVGYRAAFDWRHDAVTGNGEQHSLALDDGSTVLLGGDTALDVDLQADTRRVALARGEAYFEVAHDAARPFVVDAGSIHVRVLGTHFSVSREGDAVSVIVSEGRVEVRQGDDLAILTAGQRVRSDESGLGDTLAVDAEQALAWRRGRLIFDDAALADIAASLSRHTALTVVVANPAQRALRLSAVVDAAQVDQWLEGLDSGDSLRVVRLGSVALIY